MQHLRNRRLNAAATGRQYGFHPQTVRNRLRKNVQPIHAYRPYFGQILTRRHRTARRDWCRRHLHFRPADWDLILFSDECRFNLSHAHRRERVYRRRGERFADAYVIERDRFGGGSVLVWCGIMGGNKTRLIVINGNINVQTYINDVLAVEALPFIRSNCPYVTFMHDYARPHSAAITRQFLATSNVDVLDWPIYSPDLNPIEQVWDKLGRRVRRNHAIHTVNNLAEALQAEWAYLPAPFIERYVNCMPRRIRACVAQNGAHEIPTHFIEASVSSC